MVNRYLRETMGDAFSAKDFRTWGGTLAAFQELAGRPAPDGVQAGTAASRASTTLEKRALEPVAEQLGNTVIVCRKAYVDPIVFAGWRDGSLQRAAAGVRSQRQWEKAALTFLRRAHAGRGRRGRGSARHPGEAG